MSLIGFLESIRFESYDGSGDGGVLECISDVLLVNTRC